MKLKQDCSIARELSLIESNCKEVVELGRIMEASQAGHRYPVDHLFSSVIKLTVNNSTGFIGLVIAENMHCARSLLRTQIEIFVRLSAMWLTSDPQNFAQQVIDGTRVERITTPANELMSDRYLIARLSYRYPWLSGVYRELCALLPGTSHGGLIDDQERPVASNDAIYHEDSWLQLVEYFNHVLEGFNYHISCWVASKESGEIGGGEYMENIVQPVRSGTTATG